MYNWTSDEMGISLHEKLGEERASAVMNHIMPKTIFGLHFCRRQYGSSFN